MGGEVDDLRFTRAQDRGFIGLSREEEGTWQDDFFFIQLADTQLGMLHWDKSWAEETEMLELAVGHINRLRPRFVVVCDDLVNAFPDSPEPSEAQAADFKRLMGQIHESIPLVCLCGNH